MFTHKYPKIICRLSQKQSTKMPTANDSVSADN